MKRKHFGIEFRPKDSEDKQQRRRIEINEFQVNYKCWQKKKAKETRTRPSSKSSALESSSSVFATHHHPPPQSISHPPIRTITPHDTMTVLVLQKLIANKTAAAGNKTRTKKKTMSLSCCSSENVFQSVTQNRNPGFTWSFLLGNTMMLMAAPIFSLTLCNIFSPFTLSE